MEHPKAGLESRKEQLRQTLDERLQRFYSEETKLSDETRERLAAPGGPEDADLGLILHVQSEDDAIGPFWDPRSMTISFLKQKGLSGNFVFGYDLHWRADETFRNKSRCPASNWSQELKKLHTDLSVDI